MIGFPGQQRDLTDAQRWPVHSQANSWSSSSVPVCVFCSACQQKMRCAAHPELAYPIKFGCFGPERRFDPKPRPWRARYWPGGQNNYWLSNERCGILVKPSIRWETKKPVWWPRCPRMPGHVNPSNPDFCVGGDDGTEVRHNQTIF
jgi:hypothetical protein